MFVQVFKVPSGPEAGGFGGLNHLLGLVIGSEGGLNHLLSQLRGPETQKTGSPLGARSSFVWFADY